VARRRDRRRRAAAWKAELLSAVVVPSPEPCEKMEALAADPPGGPVMLERRAWSPADLEGAALIVAAAEDDGEALAIFSAARAAGLPINVIDKPAFCTFQFGAVVNRSPLVVGISTDGAAPVFGQAIRSRIEALLPAGFARWAEAAKSWRTELGRLQVGTAVRRRLWEAFAALALRGPERAPARRDWNGLLRTALTGPDRAQSLGHVTLVGAGPGDPALLTLKAVRALRAADVILFDDLIAPEVPDFARREAKRMLVGKTGHRPSCKQEDINALMVSLAKAGRRVVRLKAGDPMIFGRADEEIDALERAGIPFDVVPGISAAQGAAASLKVSLTHRSTARRVQLVTGHAHDGRLPQDLDLTALAVVYSYAAGRGGVHAVKLLDGFTGVLQVDGYAGYNALTDPARPGAPVTLAYCWSHLRRKFYEIYVGGHSPIATQALLRIKELYEIEAQVRGLPPELRRRARQDRSKLIVEALKPWFQQSLAAVPKGGKIGEAPAYGLNHWDGLIRLLDDRPRPHAAVP
jgi:uroporphyrin-III C-methyltransferase/precorrin-2 dehydrogenase/sirohydrochlorin ferrochelatase